MEKENKGSPLEISEEKVMGHIDKVRRQGLGRYRLFVQDPKFNFSLHSSRKKEFRINLSLKFLLCFECEFIFYCKKSDHIPPPSFIKISKT